MTYDDELNAINSHRLAAQTRASALDRKFAPPPVHLPHSEIYHLGHLLQAFIQVITR